ncbi:c-type cytochrome [Rhodovibrionaceae bacterium A322]
MSSSLEFNKIAAAVLTAGITLMVANFVAELLVHPSLPDENAFPITVADETGNSDSGAPKEEAAEIDLVALLNAGDAAKGEKLAKKCTACHSFDSGGPNKVGPGLYNVVGAKIGGKSGYSYSNALSGKSSDTWNYKNLYDFLSKPKDFAPGTKMSFAGLKKPPQAADMIAYLRKQSDNPPPVE